MSSFVGTITSTTESSRDHVTSAHPQSTADGGEEEESQQPLSVSSSSSADSSIPALLSPPKHLRHLNYLQKVTLRCKASTKRKVTLFSSHI